MADDEESGHRLLTPLQTTEQNDEICYSERSNGNTKAVCRLLYLSHFLSTWNARVFEFGAYLFLAEIYPQTLLPASVYALTRAAAAAILSPWMGHYVDTGERLRVVRWSIVGQRVSVALSCAILFLMASSTHIRGRQLLTGGLLALLCFLAASEKLSSVLNTISIERDWVVVVAEDDENLLRQLNSQMRRIDLFCKLIGPLAIAFVDAANSSIAIAVTGIMTLLSVGAEYFAIARVYRAVPMLRQRLTQATDREHKDQQRRAVDIWKSVRDALTATATYVQHQAFLPSFALALLYLTVLSFNGQMITYLLALGVTSGILGVLRGVAAIFELSATWLAPLLMERVGAIRAGIWFLNWQLVCVGIACLFFWLEAPSVTIIAVVMTVIASRVGLWGFDLSAQIIVQEEVDPELRGAFSSQEFAFQNVFEMLSFASTIFFAEPEQFKIPATISAGAVAVAGVLYAAFVRQRRGHLIHLSQCIDRHHRKKQGGWRRIATEEERHEHELTEQPHMESRP